MKLQNILWEMKNEECKMKKGEEKERMQRKRENGN
jgi:hypothetical protein